MQVGFFYSCSHENGVLYNQLTRKENHGGGLAGILVNVPEEEKYTWGWRRVEEGRLLQILTVSKRCGQT